MEPASAHACHLCGHSSDGSSTCLTSPGPPPSTALLLWDTWRLSRGSGRRWLGTPLAQHWRWCSGPRRTHAVGCFVLKLRGQIFHHLVEHLWVHSDKVPEGLDIPPLWVGWEASHTCHTCVSSRAILSPTHSSFFFLFWPELLSLALNLAFLTAAAARIHATAFSTSPWLSSRLGTSSISFCTSSLRSIALDVWWKTNCWNEEAPYLYMVPISRLWRLTVVRQFHDIRATVANTKKSQICLANATRVSHECCTSVARMSHDVYANSGRILAQIALEIRATFVQYSCDVRKCVACKYQFSVIPSETCR